MVSSKETYLRYLGRASTRFAANFEKFKSTNRFMSSQKCDQFISPSIADRRWKERVDSASRPHPFKAVEMDPAVPRFAAAKETTYNSNFSASSKQDYHEKTLLTVSVPPAGRPSFHREMLREEVARLARDKQYQEIIAKHMRSRHKEEFKTTNQLRPLSS